MKEENYAFTNCTVIDGTKNKEPINDAVILVKNSEDKSDKMSIPSGFQAISLREEKRGIILEVGKNIAVPSGYKVIDLKGKYVMPGLINLHAHLTGTGKAPSKEDINRSLFVDFLGTWPGEKYALSVIKGNLANALNAGVTTIRSLGEPYYYDVEIRDEIEENKFLGPRILASGRIICSTGGFGHRFNALIADSPYEGRKAVRLNALEGVDLIKVANTSGVNNTRKIGDAGRLQMTQEELSAICDEAHRAGLMVACHSQSTSGVKEALLAGADTIEHGAQLDDELIKLFKDNKKSLRGYSALIPTLSSFEAIAQEGTSFSPAQMKNGAVLYREAVKGFQKALKEGVKIGVGTDAGLPHVFHHNLWKELEFFVKYGNISSLEAIYMATLGNAKIMGIDGETGSIKSGRSADLIVLSKNPLEDLSLLAKPFMVMVRGNLIKKPQIKEAWF